MPVTSLSEKSEDRIVRELFNKAAFTTHSTARPSAKGNGYVEDYGEPEYAGAMKSETPRLDAVGRAVGPGKSIAFQVWVQK
jgi:hypothetical protein